MRKKPKIIIFDIEILPNLRAAQRHWTRLDCQWKKVTMTRTVSSIINIGWKELGKKQVHCINAWDFPKTWKKDINNDYHVCKAFEEIVRDANGFITHNGVKFDYKYVNTALMFNGLPILPKLPHMDTKTLSSRNLSIVGNGLKDVSAFFNAEGKLDNGGWGLWDDVQDRKRPAMKLMEKYCKQDVRATEDAFYKLRPFAGNIPNYNLFTGDSIESFLCPSCGGDNLNRNGTRRSKTMTYQRYLCGDCGSSSKVNTKGKRPVSI